MNSASKLDNGRDKSAEVSSSSSPNETRKGLSFGTRLDDRSAESAQPQRQRRLWQPPASDGHRATEKSRPGLKILKRAPRQKHTSKPLPKRTQDMKSAEQRAKEYEELKAGIWQEVETGKGGTPVNDKTKVAPAILQKFLKGRSGGNNGGQGRRGGRAHHNHHQQQQHRGRGYGRRYARGGRGHATGNGYFTPDTEKVDYSDSRFRQVRNPPLSTHDGWGRMEGGGTRAAYGYPGQRLHSHTRATNSYINNNNNNNNSDITPPDLSRLQLGSGRNNPVVSNHQGGGDGHHHQQQATLQTRVVLQSSGEYLQDNDYNRNSVRRIDRPVVRGGGGGGGAMHLRPELYPPQQHLLPIGQQIHHHQAVATGTQPTITSNIVAPHTHQRVVPTQQQPYNRVYYPIQQPHQQQYHHHGNPHQNTIIGGGLGGFRRSPGPALGRGGRQQPSSPYWQQQQQQQQQQPSSSSPSSSSPYQTNSSYNRIQYNQPIAPPRSSGSGAQQESKPPRFTKEDFPAL